MLDEIPGFAELTAHFGGWPSFHDAEVAHIHLRREGTSAIGIVHVNSTAVEILLDGVTDLELTDFSHQNVIFGLDLQHTETGWRLSLHPCFGISGWIETESIRFQIAPGSDARGQ